MTNRVIGYPRSGNNWLQNRLVLFCYKCLGQIISVEDMPAAAHISHYGYGTSETFPSVVGQHEEPQQGDNIFLVLRNPQGILNSLFFYMHTVLLPEEPSLANSLPDTIEQFATSPLGVIKLCNFLNNMKSLIQDRGLVVEYLFYEEAFQPEFLHVLPRIMGSNYQLTEEDITWVYKHSEFKGRENGMLEDIPSQIAVSIPHVSEDGISGRFRKGQLYNYHNTMPKDTQQYIQEYLEQHCQLQQYREKYLS
jgi:hypothetical protein